MKPWHYIVGAIVLYEAFMGTVEIVNSNDLVNLQTIAEWPSVGSVVFPSVAGAVDLTTAVLLYFIVLHKHLF